MIQIEDSDIPITVAQKIINGMKPLTVTPLMRFGTLLREGAAPEVGEQTEIHIFSDHEIREIAEYLLTYSKHREEETDD